LSSTELTTPATTSTQNVINISRRSFAAPSRRGNNNNNKGNGGNSSEPLSNESLIKTLIKNAGAATADDVTVRLVIDEGAGQPSTVDIMKLTQAIQVSVDRGIDLVGASIDNVDPPVVRAIDLAKLQFQRQHALKKRQQENSSSSGGNKEKKSFRFRSGIDDHDLERKLSQMISFLQKGHDCDYSVFTKARSMRENTAAGSELVERIQALLADHAVLKKDPEMNETGSFYKVMLRPKKS
jgi:translation initiation factor IF-3